MPCEVTEEHFEITARNFLVLSGNAVFWDAAIKVVAEPDVGYTLEELVEMTVMYVNPYAIASGYKKMGKYSMLGRILNELHCSGAVRRFARGFYKSFEHEPYGVLWMVKWN